MHDAFAVSGVEPVGDLDGDGEKGVHVHGAAGDGVFQRGAFEIFHGDEGFAGVFADIVDRADVGMAERGGRFGFAAETLEGLAIAGEIIGQEFQRDKTIEARVFCFVDDAHSSTAKFFDDAVMRDGLTEDRLGVRHG